MGWISRKTSRKLPKFRLGGSDMSYLQFYRYFTCCWLSRMRWTGFNILKNCPYAFMGFFGFVIKIQ